MNLVEYLVTVLKIMGLVALILILFDIILDALIITPIKRRNDAKREEEILDLLIEKMKNNDDSIEVISGDDEDDEKIED